MERGPNEAFDLIRKHLQVILLRAELCQTPQQCETCASMVCEIVKKIRELEAFVRDAAKERPHDDSPSDSGLGS